MKTESQNKQILDHLMKGSGISQKLAAKMFGCYRLSARIKNLRDSGFDIYARLVDHDKSRFALYYMENSAHFTVYGEQYIANAKS